MKDQWNTGLHGDLANAFSEGIKVTPAEVRFHKETHSGFWGGNTEFAQYIKREGLRTLLFAGVNTDQCVFSTMQDAAQQGYGVSNGNQSLLCAERKCEVRIKFSLSAMQSF